MYVLFCLSFDFTFKQFFKAEIKSCVKLIEIKKDPQMDIDNAHFIGIFFFLLFVCQKEKQKRVLTTIKMENFSWNRSHLLLIRMHLPVAVDLAFYIFIFVWILVIDLQQFNEKNHYNYYSSQSGGIHTYMYISGNWRKFVLSNPFGFAIKVNISRHISILETTLF